MTKNVNKLRLLLWKNYKLQSRRKLGSILTIFLPIILSLTIILIRQQIDPVEITKPTVFAPVNINLDFLKNNADPQTTSPVKVWRLVYSPKNDILDKIIQTATDNLKLEPFIGFSNSKKLEEFMQKGNQSIVAIEFDDVPYNSFLKIITYRLRFPSELRMYPEKMAKVWNTIYLYPLYTTFGPRNPFLWFGGEPGYVREGFIAVQNAISFGIIQHFADIKNTNVNIPEIKLQRFPYPPYEQDDFINYVHGFITLIFVLSYINFGAQTIKDIGNEKENQLKEAMKIMGLSNWLHWCAWFIKSFILMAIPMTIIIILYVIKFNGLSVIQYSNVICVLIFCYAYCTATITYLFMITTFFSSAKTASAMNALIWFLFYIPFTLTEKNYRSLNLAEKSFLSLFHNTALGFGLKLIFQYESTHEGLQWNNVFRPINIDDNLSIGLIIIMLLISSLLYLLIALYIEKIYPGAYGVPEKWNFPFKKNFWIKANVYDNNIEENNLYNTSGFEEYPINKKVGVSIRNLSKKYDSKNAVKNLSMNLFENEITVLLGHNGAGKTTTISMLTGIIPPTSGTAIINGSDIRKDVAGVRKSLGLCPQYNILFDELTVREHIIFYSRVKGMKSKKIEKEVKKYLNILKLQKKKNTLSKKLSGGMKRKLSIICALCGNSKVVFLDEPSAGMDPGARRTLWDILKVEKQNRTILLSTHFMDEADAVSDRIAIMSSGYLKSYGTSFYLKSMYGKGYNLICVKNTNCNPEAVTANIRKFIPNIEIYRNIGNELTYKLPISELAKFEKMLADLEKNSQQLNIEGYGISNTSLEEVFMEVGAEKQDYNEDDNNNDLDPCSIDLSKDTFTVTKLSQFKAMFLKRYLCARRNYKIFLLQCATIIFLLALAIFAHNTENAKFNNLPLSISLDTYNEVISILELNNPSAIALKVAEDYEKYVKSYGKNFKAIRTQESFTPYILKENIALVNLKYLIAVTFNGDNINAWFNNQLLHTAPLALNIIHNAILRTISPDFQINVINHPLPISVKTQFNKGADFGVNTGFDINLNLSCALSFATAFYILFIIKECQSRAKLLQFVSGVRVPIFWLSHLIFDYIIFIFLTILIIIIYVSFQVEGFSTVGELSRITMILLFFGLAVIPFIYLFSLIFSQPIAGYSYVSFFNIICAAIFIVIFVLKSVGKEELATTLHYIFMIFPVYALATGLNNINIISTKTSLCTEFCKQLEISPCNWEILCQIDPSCCTIPRYFEFHKNGIAWNLIYLSITCLLCLTILMLLTLRIVKELFKKRTNLCGLRPKPIKYGDSNIDDDDVKEESRRIGNMSEPEIQSYNLILNKVTKYYGNFLAVNKISVAVDQSECFGLLGINGAGKTTLFKMMVGDEVITHGKALVKGKSLKYKMNEIYRNIGYCPQFDALLEELTGREILHIFCLLRGVPKSQINELTIKLATLFDYKKHIDKRCGKYSGGNKRKLSTSIAILGCPEVIYLDEPTSGMDPGAKRKLWNVIHSVRTYGKSIVLTSHSMEECEALCTRLAVMVNGEFKCIGSTQHLKNKFGKGFTLKIKAKKNVQQENGTSKQVEPELNVNMISYFIEQVFLNAVLEEKYQDMLTYNIPTTSVKWSEIFGIMERNKIILNIEDYSISQTTLEQIFLMLAENQIESKF